MFTFYSRYIFSALLLAGLTISTSTDAQQLKRTQPKWWFGESAGANLNEYRGNTQALTGSFTVPTAFHKGQSVKPYAAILAEYRPNNRWGGMLSIAYDNRGGKFDQVTTPCDCAADLKTNLSYITVEPALRFAPFRTALYVFAGPTVSINISKDFLYTQEKQLDTREDFSDIRKVMISAQAGAGIDIPLSKRNAEVQMTLSPFASFQTDLLQSPRSSGDWSVYSVRAGVALKLGKGKVTPAPVKPVIMPEPLTAKTITPSVIPTPAAASKEIMFSVRAPKLAFPVIHRSELLPLLNVIFFDKNETTIPSRYVLLDRSSSLSFSEDQLQQTENIANNRGERQMNAYHNLLNVIGSRMRNYPQANITLAGTVNNLAEQTRMANNIKDYLVSVFGINASRILIDVTHAGKPVSQKNSLQVAEDRKIEITSTSPEILAQVGELKDVLLPVVPQSNVIFTAVNAKQVFAIWSVRLTGDDGTTQNFGPYQQDEAVVTASTILKERPIGNYTATMTGQTATGETIQKEAYLSLAASDNQKIIIPPFAVLFGFDKAVLADKYQMFLTQTVAPLITANATVTIFGYADAIGADAYNLKLSRTRVDNVKTILENALTGKGVSFRTFGFGKDKGIAPFNNTLPEERFYNRTILIGIDQVK